MLTDNQFAALPAGTIIEHTNGKQYQLTGTPRTVAPFGVPPYTQWGGRHITQLTPTVILNPDRRTDLAILAGDVNRIVLSSVTTTQ